MVVFLQHCAKKNKSTISRSPLNIPPARACDLTQRPDGAGLLGHLALLRPGPRYVGLQPRIAEVLGLRGGGLRDRRRELHRRGATPGLLVGVGDLVGVRRRAAGRSRDGLADRGGGPEALAGGGGEDRSWGGVVGRGTSGGGAAGR